MSDEQPSPAQDVLFTAEEARPHHGPLRRAFWAMASGFWRGETKAEAWTLTLLIVALIGAGVATQYGINRWNKTFFDALDARNTDLVRQEMLWFVMLAVAAVAAMVAQTFCRLMIQARWRRWLTGSLAGQWLRHRRFYQMSIAAPEIDSPEFRMTDDARIATEPLVDFAIGLSNAILMAVVFVGVLWTAGGSIQAFGVTIPGYFVLAATTYAVLTSGTMVMLGQSLVTYNGEKNAAEAEVRFNLVRVRENAESIALIGGEEDEDRAINAALALALRKWRQVFGQHSKLNVIIYGNVVLAPVVPLLLGAPKYLAGEMSLGQLMQIAAAFVQVQGAFNWLVENYIRFAEWQASAGRVVDLWRTFRDLAVTDEQARIQIGESPDDALRLKNLDVVQHNGRIVINGAEAAFKRGEKVLLRGGSGTGKSTLIRAIAGLWPWGSGEVLVPKEAKVMFVPQKPYMPHGTLKNALLYPDQTAQIPERALIDALHRCGLRQIAPRLNDEQRWDKILSGGEQQRIAFARLLVQKPEIVIMDEATSALDEASQDSMLSLFRSELDHCTVLSVGHRPGLEDYHDRTIELTLKSSGAVMGPQETPPRGRLFGQLLRRALRPRPSPDPGEQRSPGL